MELVIGPFRPALESAFRDTFAALRRGDPLEPLAVIAPSKRITDRLKDLALEAVPGGYAAVRFFNLFSFARTIYEEEASRGFTLLLDNLVPERLLRAIIRRHFADGPYLSRALPSPSSLLGAMHELQAGAVVPDQALKLLIEGELGPEDAPKLSELLSLYKRYAEELRRRRLHERSDVVRLAAAHAAKSQVVGRFKHLLYYGFYDLDQNQLDLLREVRRRIPCTVFFPYHESPGYAFAKDFLRTLIVPMADRVRELTEPAPMSQVRQMSVSGAQDEVWLAAKEILKYADHGIPYDQIGLVARTLDPYLDLLEPILREHRIPFVSSARRRLGHDPRVKAARLLFSIDDFDRGDLLDLLRSPFMKDRRGDRPLWDQGSRLLGIGHGREEWQRRLGTLAGRDYIHSAGERSGSKPFTLGREEVDLFWGAVRPLLEAPAPPETGWKAFADWALARYRQFLEPDTRIERAIESLASLETLALDEPLEVLQRVLADLSEPLGGTAGVRVLDAMAARGCSFQALVVVGMNEKTFPRYILEDPFLRDSVRSRFEHRLGCRMARKMAGYDEERLLFTLLQEASPDILYIYQRSDDHGRLQIPSIYLKEGDDGSIARRPSERLEQTEFDLLTPREAALRTGHGESLGRALGWNVEPLIAAKAFIQEIEKREGLTPFDGIVDTRSYWPSVAGFGISPTALERLASCPFKFFAHGMLDLEDLDEPESQELLSPLEIGDIYHDVLERYHRHGNFDAQLAAGFRRFEESRSIRYPVLWDVERERIEKVLRAMVDADDLSVFKPKDFEVKLEAELPIEAGGRKTVRFRGFADRLDLAPGGAFRVVDYKRSGKKYRGKMETGVFKDGRFLQPPLYFMLAQKILNAPSADSRFSYYFLDELLDEDAEWEKVLTGEMWERKPEFLAHLKRYLDRIARGEFIIRDGKDCQYCDFRTLCRRGHWPTRVRAEASDDPQPGDGKDAG